MAGGLKIEVLDCQTLSLFVWMSKMGRGFENNSVWHISLLFTYFREVEASPFKMKGPLGL